MTATRSRFSRPVLSVVCLLCLAAGAACSSDGDDKGGDGDGDGDSVSTGDGDGDGDAPAGSGASAGTGASTGSGANTGAGAGTGDGDGDGDFTPVDPDAPPEVCLADLSVEGAGDGNGGGGNTPAGFAGCALTSTIAELGGVYSTDDNNGPDDHNSMYGANPRIVPAPRGDGSFDVAWQTDVGVDTLYITHVEETGGVYNATWHLAVPSLGVIGGLAIDESGEPVVVTAVDERIAGDVDPVKVHRPDIMAVVRVGSDCQEKYREDLRTDFDGNGDSLPLYSPFTAGTSRLAVGGGTYVLHYSQNTEYDDGVNSRHQIGRYILGSSETGEVSAVQGNISHSFDQRLHFDGTDFVSLSLGDASLRGIALSHTTTAGTKTQRTILAIKGGDSETGGGYNNTFTRLGDVAKSASGYVSVFSTELQTSHPERVSYSRNVGFVHSPADFYTIEQPEKYDIQVSDTATGNACTESWDVDILDYWANAATGMNKEVAWITDYDDRLTAHAERPKLVRWSEDRFFIVWEKWGLDDYEATYAAITDEWGNVIEGPTSLGAARLPRGDDAFLINGNAAWLEGTAGSIVLHLVDTTLTHTTQTL